MSQHPISVENHLLASMSPGDFGLLRSHLEPVSLQTHEVLVEPYRAIEHLFYVKIPGS